MRPKADVAGRAGTHPRRNGEQAGTVLICYDGSSCSRAAIAEAGRELGLGRQALVLTVWEPFVGTGFGLIPASLAAPADEELTRQAEKVAGQGTTLAREAGFDAEPLVELGAPVWRRITEVANERDVDLIVLGSHGRSGLRYLLLGSVATAVTQHAGRPVLIASEAGAQGSPAATPHGRRSRRRHDWSTALPPGGSTATTLRTTASSSAAPVSWLGRRSTDTLEEASTTHAPSLDAYRERAGQATNARRLP